MEDRPTKPAAKRRWYRLTPDRFLIGLLATEGTLLLSEQFRWFPFNEHKGWTVLIAVAGVCAALLLMMLWFAAGLLLRRRFQFSLRSLLVLVVVVAVPCSWMAVKLQEAKRQRETVYALWQADAVVLYDCEIAVDGSPSPGTEPADPEWLWRFLGIDFFCDAVVVADHFSFPRGMNELNDRLRQSGFPPADASPFPPGTLGDEDVADVRKLARLRELWLAHSALSDTGLAQLAGLSHIDYLELGGTQITDAGLEHLREMSRLEVLDLNETRIRDDGLAYLSDLPSLRSLILADTEVNDAGLEHLGRSASLQAVDLSNTQITDAGLEHLKRLSSLQFLELENTDVTEEGIAGLKQVLPACEIR